ncbi:hypothetical protein CL614_08470 [archaeon]|nr:hypothetical protein [archaeon]|tara:strand:+ start:1089 stop:1565 length:477 start_codon:yes stop_codon:yes gene_type:complete
MKKGVSPLIASVLTLAFVITIFVVVTNFVQSDVVDETIDKTTSKLERQLDCNSIDIRVVNACVDSLDEASSVGVNLDNFGEDVSNVVIRVLNDNGDLGVADFSSENPVSAPNRILKKNNLLDLNEKVKTPSLVEVYAKSTSESLCEKSKVIIDKIEKC